MCKWKREPHTEAKHRILKRYLQAWMPILTRRAHEPVRYFDAFAGPGRYLGGEPGSPLIAIETALEHSELAQPVHMTFIDNDAKCVASLEEVLEPYRAKAEQSPNIILDPQVLKGKCESHLTQVVNDYERRQRAAPPALFFLDQFGYSCAPMPLIHRLLSVPMWEVFGLFEWSRFNQCITDPHKENAISRAFGDDRWRPATTIGDARAREDFIVSEYRRALEEAGDVVTWHFSMRDKKDRLIYWLFFASRSLKGLYEMKKAMRGVDATPGGYSFSDYSDAGTEHKLLYNYDQAALANDLARELHGRTLDIAEVYRYVLTRTPEYQYVEAMRVLEDRKQIRIVNPPRGRRRGAFETYRGKAEPLLIEFIHTEPNVGETPPLFPS